MRIALLLAVSAAAALAAGAASAASVEVRDAVARVTVIPEARSDVKVEIVQANPRLPIEVRTFAGQTIVDGHLGHRIRDCHGRAETVSVKVRDLGDVAWKDMPQIVIRTPRDVDVDAGGAVWGSVGRSASVKLGNAGCGDWTVGNTDGDMRISQAGSGDTRTGSAGAAKVRVAGSGDTATGDIKGGLEVDIAGSGDVAVASIAGPLKVHVAGSGDVKIAAGRASEMRVAVMGSGSVDFRGSADALHATIAGSGDVRAKQVNGPVTKTVMGSGGVTIGN
jgi:Putative auto-transporter adhesin, head GIN domain